MSIDTFVEYNNLRSPFHIQQRCRLVRFYEVIEKGLGIEITEIIHKRHGKIVQVLTADKKSSYLIEDFGIKQNDIIVVNGIVKGKINVSTTVIKLQYRDLDLFPVQITNTTNVKHILDMVCHTNLFVPDTVKLFYNGGELTQWNKLLITDLQIKHDDHIEVKGLLMPLPKDYEYMYNLRMYPEINCVVCMNSLPGHKYECGHINVCSKCYQTGKVEKCPVCNC